MEQKKIQKSKVNTNVYDGFRQASILELLTIFRTVAEVQSFSKAATLLGHPKSKVSRTIGQLEHLCQFRLIERTTRQVVLTREGSEILEKILPLVDQLESALENAFHQKEEMSGKITLTAPEDLGIEIVGKILPEFIHMHPKVETDLRVSNKPLDIIHEKIDLAIRIGKLRDSSYLKAQKIASLKMVCVINSTDALKSIRSPEELLNFSYLHFGDSTAGKTLEWSKGAQKIKMKFRPAHTCNSFYVVKELALNKLGWAVIPRFLVEKELFQKKLIQLLPDWDLPAEEIYLLSTGKANSPARTRSLHEFIIRRLQFLN